ncbi:calcium-binding EF hand family protein [Actinidia rufa]|uniref:Calcium-binding EF hand family protein n=1 Tax=Actinidia rufa TaxID=165716 RepID=A0A7J0H140_9ERIC|nr:calcium-binding EF hand family protein [Actinidia rufa]
MKNYVPSLFNALLGAIEELKKPNFVDKDRVREKLERYKSLHQQVSLINLFPVFIPKKQRTPRMIVQPDIMVTFPVHPTSHVEDRSKTVNQKQRVGQKRVCSDCDEENGGTEKRMKKTVTTTCVLPEDPAPALQLPANFRAKIEGLNSSEIVLVFQKKLFDSDVSKCQCRLLMPHKQIKTHGFLTPEERDEVLLIDPSCQKEWVVSLKIWEMGKSNNNHVNYMYSLGKNWYKIVQSNGLKTGMIVQLWAFRVESNLRFALVKVGTPSFPPEENGVHRFLYVVSFQRLEGLASPTDAIKLQWVSAIALGSSVGLVWYSSSSCTLPDSEKRFSFADWSTPGVTEVSVVDQFSNRKFLFGDAFRRKVFFNYEKRIRMRSPPEKVFDYFASYRTPEGDIFMTPADLMRAVVPVFPPSESHLVRDGYLRGERSPGELRCAPSEFFMLFDMNNDGLVSFKEYIFFVTLLSIPESSFSVAFKMFDIDCNGEIDREEFKNVMDLMRAHHRQGASHRDGLRAGVRVGGSVENGGLVEYFFGKDGKECLQHEKFVQFLRSLYDEMVRLEFAHYDYKLRGTISAKDFALSMVASADMRHLNKLLDRVDELNESNLSNVRITLEEFKNFAELRKRLQSFSLALFGYGKITGLLTKKDFQRAASQVCGVSLTDNVVEIIFHVFDANRDGSLSCDEFVRVLEKRERDIAHPTEAGILDFLSCCGHCASNSSIRRFLS